MSERGETADHYILDSRTTVGNCALWWRPNGQGYCCNLDDAGLYTREDAESHRDTDIAVPRAVAEQLVVRHVRLDHLRQNLGLDDRRTRAGAGLQRTIPATCAGATCVLAGGWLQNHTPW